jgi:hypothetical protein
MENELKLKLQEKSQLLKKLNFDVKYIEEEKLIDLIFYEYDNDKNNFIFSIPIIIENENINIIISDDLIMKAFFKSFVCDRKIYNSEYKEYFFNI